ncbi:DUF4760 domain-containing protein [Bradyrhizobium sp. CB1650]|uniref:DUF4760 domain-containing protein n=1 Tax=Bradyrhizobium sp. CB1650 TaxID=3039153 RepID=UPI002435E6B4|nr:DUF4760 domain-containing protein [Bradyrhizobium sp. CB1650]WGD51249.1 DUF4760 domain-containing protein [Bradyrhizobium sp. CB1650]
MRPTRIAAPVMPTSPEDKVVCATLLAFTAWLFVGLPIFYMSSEGEMFDWGTVPQWLTALIAGGALIAAMVSISSQREIARKRAAMDFFAKTEMDRDTLASHKKFTDAVAVLDTHLKAGKPCADFVSTPEYWHIREYLNLHELMAVGVKNDVFDDHVCFNFWSRELGDAYRRTKQLIEYIQPRKPTSTILTPSLWI